MVKCSLCVGMWLFLLKVAMHTSWPVLVVPHASWWFCSTVLNSTQFQLTWCYSLVKPMTDDPSSPSKKLVRETRMKNSVCMSCILARVFLRCEKLVPCWSQLYSVQVSRASISYEFLGRSTWVVCHGLYYRSTDWLTSSPVHRTFLSYRTSTTIEKENRSQGLS